MNPYFATKFLLRVLAVLRGLDRRDDLVEDVQRLDEPFQHMGPILRLLQLVLRAVGDHFLLVLDVRLQHLL